MTVAELRDAIAMTENNDIIDFVYRLDNMPWALCNKLLKAINN